MTGAAVPLSVIIPTLEEGERIGRLLASLAAEDIPCEIIVADGGSADGTAAIARNAGATVIDTPRGRGQQCHAGARAARAEVLLFLHADTVLPRGALAAILQALEKNPQAPGGNFRLLFDGDTGFDRWLIGFYAWIRSIGLYYGDSGIFIRRKVYEKIGGIRPVALMEDYDLVRRMERAGPTICIEEPPLLTSSRKFRGRRPVAIVCGWLWIHALWHLGVPPHRLARFYYGPKGTA